MQMLKYKLYNSSDKSITFIEFDNALRRMVEFTTMLKTFETKEKAVDYLMKETNSSIEECSMAYDFYINLFSID